MSHKPDLPAVSQDIIRLYDEYTHAPLSRRDFFQRLTRLAGGTAAAYAILPLLENNYAQAQQVAASDSRLQAADTVFGRLGDASLNGYRVQPAHADVRQLPAVIVIHENRGLNPHIRDVARRLALEGFVVLAPDYLSTKGGTPADEDKAREMFGSLDAALSRDVSLAALAYLQAQGNGKVGAVGFCWGGGQVGQLAVHASALGAGVVYYGAQPAAADVPRIKAPLLLHYAALDERINAGIPAFEDALKAAGTRYTLQLYPDVNHAFNNDTNAARYDKAAAELAWGRTVAFLRQQLA
ncbi:carboxymethylenebutenolidase [Vogesella perlucida]|nr:carboxymethylenebutenolidase [Vogesella perlucida]